MALQEREPVQGGESELRQGWGREQAPVRGAASTEGARQEVPLEVRGAGQSRAEGGAVAEEAAAQGRGSLAGRWQREGSREAGGAFHSPSEAVQNLERARGGGVNTLFTEDV